ncbi:hypothetical protein Tco_1261165, partial [Tanacetum coccineum]
MREQCQSIFKGATVDEADNYGGCGCEDDGDATVMQVGVIGGVADEMVYSLLWMVLYEQSVLMLLVQSVKLGWLVELVMTIVFELLVDHLQNDH